MKLIRLAILLVLGFASIAYAASQKFSYIQTNFTSGEFSPKMYGRVDFAKYFNAAKTIENFIIQPQGGVTRRPGTQYVATAKVTTENVRLIPFEFSATQAYIIEMGDHYMRFYMNGGQIVNVDSYTKLLLHCNGNNNSTVFVDDGITNHSANITAVNGAKVKTSTYKFPSGSMSLTSDTQQVSISDHVDWYMGTGTFTIDMWVNFAILPGTGEQDVIFRQSDAPYNANKLIYLALHNDGGTLKLRFYNTDSTNGGAQWDVKSAWTPVVGTWYHVAAQRGFAGNANRVAISVDGHALTSSMEAGTDAWGNFNGPFVIGGLSDLSWFDGYIDEFRVSKGTCRWTTDFTPPTIEYPMETGGTIVEVYTDYDLEDIPDIKYVQSADTMWMVHPDYKPYKLTRSSHVLWSFTPYTPKSDLFTGAGLYPNSTAFFEERLVFAGPDSSPQSMFFSASGNFENFTTSSTDDSAINITIAADQVNTITWLEPGRVLVVGTIGGEWKTGASSLDDPITPDNITVRRETAHGTNSVQAITVGKKILFVQRAGKTVREFGYNFDVDGYITSDLNILADHILDSPIIDWAYQQEPNSTIWVVTQAGNLYSLTYHKDHDIVAWARHELGGTDVVAKSVACILSSTGTEDELWLSVERTINGATTNYIERMMPTFSGSDTTDAFFVDSGLTYDGAAVTTISGLGHLEGETVVALGDGINLTSSTVTTPAQLSLTVASGGITLGKSCSVVHVGLPYNSNIETLRLAVPQDGPGTVQGKTKRISAVTVRFLESMKCKIGPTTSNLVAMDFTETNTVFSGDKSILYDGNYEEEGYIYLRQDEPLPLTVLAIVPEVRVSD